jgi:hypothetical protein
MHQSLAKHGEEVCESAAARLAAKLHMVDGDYRDDATFAALRAALDGAARPGTEAPAADARYERCHAGRQHRARGPTRAARIAPGQRRSTDAPPDATPAFDRLPAQ